MSQSLLQEAQRVRLHAYAPYSGLKVGAAVTAASGAVFVGCNVENAAYPQGTCAEAGAIAAMVAAGETRLLAVAVVADCPEPIAPCGGCRQKLVEFGAPDVVVTMANTAGIVRTMTLQDLLPGAFDASQLGEL